MSSKEPASGSSGPAQLDPAQHYSPASYLTPWRMAAIGYQIALMHRHFPKASVLEVGVGSALTTHLLRTQGHPVTTLDLDARLAPDLLGSVTRIPCSDRALDAFLCCQVLEHLPWDALGTALSELRRVTKLGGVISVPTLRPTWLLTKYGPHNWGTRRFHPPSWRPHPIRHASEHHWELEANVRTRDFVAHLQNAGFDVLEQLQPVECLYHHFFALRPQPS